MYLFFILNEIFPIKSEYILTCLAEKCKKPMYYLCTLVGNFKVKCKGCFALCFVVSKVALHFALRFFWKVQTKVCPFDQKYKLTFAVL